MAPALDSVFDLAFWFYDQGLNNSEYIQPAKLHSLLFISQAYYASISDGEKLLKFQAEGQEFAKFLRSLEKSI